MATYKYVIKRTLATIPVILLVAIITFFLIRLIPGDVITMLIETNLVLTPEQVLVLKARYGLDKPVLIQLTNWLVSALNGDLGDSFRKGTPVLAEIAYSFPVSIQLAIMAFTIAIFIALISGILAAVKQNSLVDLIIKTFNTIQISMPSFWLGILVIIFLANFKLYRIGYVNFLIDPIRNLSIMIPPSLVMSMGLSGNFSRLLRGSLLDTLEQDFIRTARGKGLKEKIVLFRHALKNSLIPVITSIGTSFGQVLGGSVVVETIFSIPGMGRLIIVAIYDRDYPIIQGIMLVSTICYVFINLGVDLFYSYLDPRIRY